MNTRAASPAAASAGRKPAVPTVAMLPRIEDSLSFLSVPRPSGEHP